MRERLWGQLAYNDDLGDGYWQAVLEHRFPGVDGGLLLKAWESVSEVVPRVNRSVWSPTDGSFGAEACRRTSGFLTLDGYHFERPSMVLNRIDNGPDPQCITVMEYAKASLAGAEPDGLTPPRISENPDGYAAVALNALPTLRAQMGDNVELRETLNDIESMAYLGRYYTDKMRAATITASRSVVVFRENCIDTRPPSPRTGRFSSRHNTTSGRSPNAKRDGNSHGKVRTRDQP